MAFSELCCLFYGFWHIGKFGGGKKDESPCTVVFGANTMVFRANTVYFVWKIQQYFGYSVFFCLFFNTVVFSGKYSGILRKKIKFRVNTMILWASTAVFLVCLSNSVVFVSNILVFWTNTVKFLGQIQWNFWQIHRYFGKVQ